MEKWEDISILNENVLKAHATFSYQNKLDLNGIWDYTCIKGSDNVPQDLNSVIYGNIEVPCSVELKGYSQAYYYGASFPPAINKKKIPTIDHKQTHVSLYRKIFEINEISEQMILRFDSVKSAFSCYLNDKYLGMAKCSMLPIEFDITDQIQKGSNKLNVIVWQFSDATYLEGQDMWFLSGIDRSVSIYGRSNRHIEDVFLHNKLSNEYKDAELLIDLETSCADGNITIEFNNEKCTYPLSANHTSISIPVKDVHLWSAEDPYLYQVKISLDDSDTQTFNYGFKEVKVDHGKGLFLFNGKNIKLRGMNYHAFTPDYGHYVPEEVYEKDLKLMKKFNINAIRTSHYPQADIFYELCDRYGIYVMDEVNVESHGVRKKVPQDDPRWLPQMNDRMARMVLRDRNHPCVTIWSLGNESAVGSDHFKMKETALSLDQSRPIHYEGGTNLKLSDFMCTGYSPLEREQKFAQGKDVENQPTILQKLIPLMMSSKSMKFEEYKGHPVIATEYNYCMGNSSCDVAKHVELFDKSDRWCGGFVWDFKDKALRIDDKFVYGGDLTDKDQKGNVCCDGACDPDSIPHSVFYEIKHAFQDIVCDYKDGSLEIYNRNFFVNANIYHLRYEITRNGETIESHEPDIDVKPRETKIYPITINNDLKEEGIYYLNVYLLRKEETQVYEKDEVRCYDQFFLKDNRKTEKTITTSINLKEDCIELLSSDTVYLIDRNSGNITQIKKDDKEYLNAPLRPCFYRPIVDGEAGFIGLAMAAHLKTNDFAKLSFNDLTSTKIEIKDDEVVVSNDLKQLNLTRVYTIVNDSLRVEVKLHTKKKAPNRFGMSLQTDPAFVCFDWFGKGPHDTYQARDDSGIIGDHHQDVRDQDEYVRPQEHGNKTHVDHLRLSDNEGRSITAFKDGNDLSTSVWPYTLKDLHEAQHIHELPSFKVTTLNIDCIQNGLGDCFNHCPEEYKLQPDSDYQYAFYLKVK